MSRFTQPTNGVVQPYELVDLIVTRLQAVAVMATALGSASNVYAHRTPASKPSGNGWAVVREVAFAGGAPEQDSGLQRITVQVMTECPDTLPKADKWHAATQNRIAETLLASGWDPTFTTLAVAVPISRTSPATPAQYDASSDSFYATSEFAVVAATI